MENRQLNSIEILEDFNGKNTENNPNNIININIEPATNVDEFISVWIDGFIGKMRNDSKSRKRDFDFENAKSCTSFITDPIDKLMINYIEFIDSNPMKGNDYYKYTNSYINGKELDLYYFRHDIEKLKEYYGKIDKAKESGNNVNVFSIDSWKTYVLFMMLKLNGLYSQKFDTMFGISFSNDREYNPATKLPSVLRAYLPFEIKEYDIKQAYPTFACIDAGIDPIPNIYEKIDKTKFNTILNLHSGVDSVGTIEEVRNQIRPIFGESTDKIITENRFNNKGQAFRDFAKYERKYIEKFVNENKLKNFARLHDGIIVKTGIECEHLSIDKVNFKEKAISKPEVITDIRNWYDDNKGTSSSQYKDWFIQEGFIRITEREKDEVTVIKNENKILINYNHISDTNSLLANHINDYNTSFLENIISKDSKAIQDAFKLMQPKLYQLHRDTKDESFIPFKNGVARITANDVRMIPYTDESIGFFAEHKETQSHKFEYFIENAENSVFKNFLSNAIIGKEVLPETKVSQRELDSFNAFITMIGYLLSNYKDPSMAHAIILSDKGANNESRSGRRGKSLLQEALKKVRISQEKGGTAFDPNYRHVYADVRKKHDIYIIDDVPAGFKYNDLYSVITGSLNVEHKGNTAEIIPFELSPKFLISTNWAVPYDESAVSTNWRFKEYQFTNYWNVDNRPEVYFKHSFFNDWDSEAWNDFYCFMVYCIQQYLKYGLITDENDKDLDNYNALFYNEVKLEEFERIIQRLRNFQFFTITDFLDVHREKYQNTNDRLFHRNNIKKHLQVYFKHNEINYSIDTKRVWHFV